MSKSKKAYAVILALAAAVAAAGVYLILHKPQPSATTLGKRYVTWFNQQPPATDRILGYGACHKGTGANAGETGCIILESRNGVESCEVTVFRSVPNGYVAAYSKVNNSNCGGRG